MDLDLTADHVDALEERTEGWGAGLQLAALSLRDVTEPAKLVRDDTSATHDRDRSVPWPGCIACAPATCRWASDSHA
jgi:hypothetical protein